MNLSNAHSFKDVVGILIGTVNIIIPVLTVLALVLFLYSGLQYVLKANDSHGKGPEREALMWGVIALFVLVSVWGLIRIMCGTFLGNSSCSTSSAISGSLY